MLSFTSKAPEPRGCQISATLEAEVRDSTIRLLPTLSKNRDSTAGCAKRAWKTSSESANCVRNWLSALVARAFNMFLHTDVSAQPIGTLQCFAATKDCARPAALHKTYCHACAYLNRRSQINFWSIWVSGFPIKAHSARTKSFWSLFYADWPMRTVATPIGKPEKGCTSTSDLPFAPASPQRRDSSDPNVSSLFIPDQRHGRLFNEYIGMLLSPKEDFHPQNS